MASLVTKAAARIMAGASSLTYDRWGEGRPVVLVHGMGSWRRTWPRVANPGYTFLALDLPGFGDSPLPPHRQSLDDFGHAFAAALAAWDFAEPPLVVGHSFGAMVITRAAALGIAGGVAGLLLVSPAGFVDPVGAMTPTPYYCLNRVLLDVTGSNLYGSRMVRALGADPDRMDRRTRQNLQYGWRHAREMARMGHFYQYPTMAADLAGAGWPYQVLVGDRDPLFPRATLEPALAGLVPHVTWMPSFGHVPFLQDGPRFQPYWDRALTALYPTGSPA